MKSSWAGDNRINHRLTCGSTPYSYATPRTLKSLSCGCPLLGRRKKVDRHKAHLDFNAALTEPYAQWLGHKWVGDPNNVTVQVDAQAAEAGRYPTPPPPPFHPTPALLTPTLVTHAAPRPCPRPRPSNTLLCSQGGKCSWVRRAACGSASCGWTTVRVTPTMRPASSSKLGPLSRGT